MAAPSISHLICSMALVVLILVMPSVYSIERDNVAARVAEVELKEVADYTSNTLENLYFLANSTNAQNVNVTKELLYLPLTVQGSFYSVRISSVGNNASRVIATLKDKSSVSAASWLIPGLRVDRTNSFDVVSKPLVACCYRNATDAKFYVSLGYGV